MPDPGPVALCDGCLTERSLAWHWRYWLCDACDDVIQEGLAPALRRRVALPTAVVSGIVRKAIEAMHAAAEAARRQADAHVREETPDAEP